MKFLSGQRVIDMTQNVAGPYCTQVLADLGAEVIKIERPGRGDDTRQWAPQLAADLSPTYATLNRGKLSVALDITRAEGAAALVKMLRPDDIVVHSLKPGSAERYGLGEAALRDGRPGLIYCAISAFGGMGELGTLPGYDPLIQAYTGIMSVNGHDGAPPARVGVSLVDMGAGLWAAIGILAALAARGDTGQGARVDTSLLETGLAWMTIPVANYSASGKLPRRLGSATAMLAPYEVFETAEAAVFIACGNDRLFGKLANALGAGQLAQDERFCTNAARVANRDGLHDSLEQLTRALTTQEVTHRLRKAGVPVSPVHDLSQALGDPQVQAIGLHRALSLQCDGEPVQASAVALPIRFDGKRPFAEAMSVRVGQDSVSVLRGAGFGADELDRLAAAGVVGL